MKGRILLLSAFLLLFLAGTAWGQAIKIGFFAPLTGFAAADGKSATVAARLAVKEINEAGGIGGRPVELVVYDDRADPKEAVAIATKLIELDKVTAAVSGSYSGATRAASPIFQKAGIPMIAAYAVHPEITRTGDFIFRASILGPIQGRGGAHVAKRLGARTASLLIMDNDFGRTLAANFKEEATRLGIKVISEDAYPLGEKEFTPLLTKLKGLNPDLVYATAYYAEAAQIARQSRAIGLKSQILGQEGYDSPKFLELAGPAADGVIITTTLNRDDPRDIVKRFMANYKRDAGVEADMVGASAYDAVRVMAEAIRRGGTDPRAIRDTIYKLKNFEGVTGLIRGWNRIGEIVKPLQVQRVTGGRFTYFAELSDPALITPPE